MVYGSLTNSDDCMSVTTILDRTKSVRILIISTAVIAVNIFVNLLLPSKAEGIFNAVFGLTIAVFAFSGIAIVYFVSRKQKYIFTHTILIIGLSMAAWVLGDASYLVLLSMKVDPFISVGDIFYITATLLLIAAALTIPGSQPPSRRRNMVFIEISILFLSAVVIFLTLLFIPGNADLNFDKLTMLMVFIYPVLDLILLWVIVILFFTYQNKSIQKVLSLLLASSFLILLSDSFYIISSLYSPVIDDYLVDIGYYFFYAFLMVASLIGYKEIRFRQPEPESVKKVAAFKQGNWIVYLPGVFLITVIGLLLAFVLNQSFVLFHGSLVMITLVIILFIIHQYLVITDNIKLTKEMRMINAQLESKVEQRTAELSNANEGLHAEMSERKKAEELLARINQELALVNREKDKLFSIMAHDLRSPLGSMMKLSELLVDNIKDFDEDELLEISSTLHASTTQTFQLLNDLLDWSAVQMGRGERKKELFPVTELVSEIVAAHTDEASAKNITIAVECPDEITAFADKFAILTVLRNLVNNAVKFTNTEGNIRIKAEINDLFTVISVIDNGTGIPKEKQDKIFRIDAIGSSPGTAGEKGTGFGLLLCKDLVQRNGGQIWLKSEKGKGSTFSFSLPLSETAVAPVLLNGDSKSGKVEYKFIHPRKIAFSAFIGNFTTEILQTELNLLWSNSDYQPDYPVLIDLRQAFFSMEVKELPKIIGFFEAMPRSNSIRKFALLTSTPQQVAFSTMFGLHIKSFYPVNVEVFSTYDAAISWIEG
jgi:signal transduction histidine kinase